MTFIAPKAYENPAQPLPQTSNPQGSGGFVAPIPNLGAPAQNGSSGSSEDPSLLGFGKNVLSSAGNAVSGLYHAVRHPFDTAQTISNIAVGGVEKLMPGDTSGFDPQKKTFDAAIDYFKQRYGSFDAVKKTAYKDPIGFALDLSIGLSGGGAALKGAGALVDATRAGEIAGDVSKVGDLAKAGETAQVAKVPNLLTKAGEGLSKAGEFVDPIKRAGQVASPLLSKGADLATKGAKEYLGFRTGAGTEALSQSFDAGKAGGTADESLVSAMRGKTTPEDILSQAKEAQAELKQQKSDAYEANLKKVADETMQNRNGQWYVKREVTQADINRGWAPQSSLGVKDSWVPTDLSIKGLKNVTTQTLKDFNINAKGTELDFSKTPLPSSHTRDLQELVDRVYKWDDTSPTGINDLKKVIDSYYRGGLGKSSADKTYNAIIQSMKENVNNYLGERVPQIKAMNVQYAKDSKNLDELTSGLSLDTKNPETAINKLKNSLRDNNEFKAELVKRLQDQSGMDLEHMIAGYALSSGVPKGAVAKLLGGGEIYASLHNPLLLLDVFASSPRAIGEIVRLLGKGSKNLERLGDLIGQYKLANYVPGKTATEAGKIDQDERNTHITDITR